MDKYDKLNWQLQQANAAGDEDGVNEVIFQIKWQKLKDSVTIARTVRPKKALTFNEWARHIRSEMNKIRGIKNK
jgi:hypothetical protein